MVPKPEYGDLHRWKVSIGVLLIFAAAAVPWAVLREPFSILATAADVQQLNGFSRLLFRTRQVLEIIVSIAAVISGPIFLRYGIRFLKDGLKGWSQLQEKFDRDQLADNQKVDEALPEATPTETLQEAKLESSSSTQEVPRTPDGSDKSGRGLRTAEQRFGSLLREALSDLYEVLESRLVGPTVVDFLCLARERPVPDLMIEVKFMGIPLNRSVVLDIVREYSQAAERYEFGSDRLPIVHLFFVSAHAPVLGDDEVLIREAAHEGKFPMIVHFMSRATFDRLQPNEVKQLLGRTKGSGTTWTP